ncbi:MAG: xanthine dehydrogenase family protein molybdopterin-binding subunit [Phycisphaerae bacterium]
MAVATDVVGEGIDRVDGRAKVTGGARYAAEFNPEGLVHAVAFVSTVAKGRVVSIDDAEARRVPGLVAILTHENMPKVAKKPDMHDKKGKPGQTMVPIQGAEVWYAGQYLGLAVAETLSAAEEAAGKVRVQYAEEKPQMWDGEAGGKKPEKMGRTDPPDSSRGDADGAFAGAEVTVEQSYRMAQENHNPMEMSAAVAAWQGDQLTLYSATQWIYGCRHAVAAELGIPEEKVRVICPFVGGAFGCKGSVWPHEYLTALAAKAVGRPVRWMLTRPQMFTGCGMRPAMLQQVKLGATAGGKLTAIVHENYNPTSLEDSWPEPSVEPARMLYSCENVRTQTRIVPSTIITPCQMRAPGHAPGTTVLEVAMDELAYALKMDPIELRLKNYAERDEHEKKAFSSKSLKECYRQAAERFGWAKRTMEPMSMRDGNELVGWGMATAVYPTNRESASARVRMLSDGTALVTTASQDLGTGTYTIMTQIAAETLRLPLEKVKFELGNSAFPKSPVSGGSQTAASTGAAVKLACMKAREQMDQGVKSVDVTHDVEVPDDEKWSTYAFGAQFAEVRVDPDLRTVRVSRVTSAFAAGRILNAKTAHSQVMGGIVMGIGMALLEETRFDPRRAKITNDNLADYLVPVNKDIPEIDCFFVKEEDPRVNEMGCKGIGEIGVTGIAAAVNNAVFHATGKRVREFPMTVEKLM